MVNQDWLYRVSSPIIAASAAANLQGQDKQIADGYAWLAAKHKQLDSMSVSDAKAQYETLTANVQESLKSMYGDAPYLQEDPSLLSKAWDVATAPLEGAWNLLGSYGEGLSNVFRVAVTGQSWDETFDGKKVFDKDLEKSTDAMYTPEVVKIAKSISTGMGFGEVLSTLSTEAEFAAFAKFVKGDQTFTNAIRDYDNAKISWGRSFARMFGLAPDIGKTDQGIEGTAYNILSGGADLLGDIIFDPLTYVAAPIKAIQGARLGLLSLATMEAIESGGKLSLAQKSARLFGGGTYDAAFNIPRVRKAYDTIGPMIQNFKNAPEAARGRILTDIQRIQPTMDAETVLQLSRYRNEAKGIDGVKDADSMLDFFKNSEQTDLILSGKPGAMEGRLATHTVLTDARLRLRYTAAAAAGFNNVPQIPDAKFDNILDELANNGTEVHTVLQAKQMKNFGNKFTRLLEKAHVNRTIYVGGQDELGRSLNAQSAGDIYSLARIFLPKYHAKVISNLYASTTDEAMSRNIVRGIFDSLAEHFGVPKDGAARKLYEEEVNKWANPVFSESTVVDPNLAKATGLQEGTQYHPGVVNGRQMALSGNQVTNMVMLPDIAKIAKIGLDHSLLSRVSKTVNGSVVTGVTDLWSALNLLPRLGIRSVIDESLMQALVLPLSLFDDVIRGYQAKITERIISSSDDATKINIIKKVKDANGNEYYKTVLPLAEDKSIGAVARLGRVFFAGRVTEADRKLAATGHAGVATVVEGKLKESKLSWFTRINDEDRRFIARNIKYGQSSEIANLGEGVTHAMNQGAVEDIASAMTSRYNLNVQQINKELDVVFGGKPTEIQRGLPAYEYQNNDYIANFFIQLNDRIDRNGFVGQLAVKYMKNPQKAIHEIAKHLRTDGANYYSRFDRSRLAQAGTRSVEQDATDMYIHVRNLFYNERGEFNDLLYKKINVGGTIDTRHLTLADYQEFAAGVPEKLMGYTAKQKGYRTLFDFVSDVIEKGFQVADRQIATLTREPIYEAYNLHYSRKMIGLEERFVKNKIAQGFSEDVARQMADQRYAQLAHDASLNRMIGYIDNPNVRSVFALNVRNVARYYRANEDFARRAIRVASDPKALVRLRMGMEGLDHSGFIHEDENGDKYFSIPVDEIVYPAYAAIMQSLGQKPMQMMPLQMTGKLKMLTPSADPESWAPTFAGPFMSIGIGAIAKILETSGHADLAAGMNTALLGKYAENKDFLQAIMPTVVKRAWEGTMATFDENSASEQITSAFFKSAAFYTANGMGLDSTATLAEREQFMRDMRATAHNIVAVRNLMGIWSPVAPSLSETVDVPEHMLDLDMTSWRSEFRSLVEAEFKKSNPNAYDDALMKWTKLFPGKLVYTVPETELDTVASIKKSKQAVGWIKNNTKLVETYRQGSTFLMPQMNSYDIDAYAFLKREGYIKSKTMDQYLEDIANVNAENEYFDMRDSFKKQIAAAATTTEARQMSANFEQQLQQFKDQRPYLKLALEHNSTGNQLKVDVLTDVRNMLNSGMVERSSTANILRSMIQEYDSIKAQLDSISSQSDSDAAFKERLRTQGSSKLIEIAGINPNALNFYNTILKRLIEG